MRKWNAVAVIGALWLAALFCLPVAGQTMSAPVPASLATGSDLSKELNLDCGNDVTMKLILIPAGEFMMGSPENEAARRNAESPQHRVKITKPFFMGVYVVTQPQYEAVMQVNPSCFKGESNPVEQVSWNDAVEFCQKLSQKNGMTVRLPTEAEWEYACRAGTTTPFNTGETISTDQANYNGNFTYGSGRKGEYRHKIVAVGSFAANGFGLYDMHGNVWQWCQDWYDAGYYKNSPTDDPLGPATGLWRVARGGSWDAATWYCRSAARGGHDPADRHGIVAGFRVVCAQQPAVSRKNDLEARLDQKIRAVYLPGVSLQQAILILKTQVGKNVNFILDPDPKLNLAAVQVQLDLKDVTLRTLLHTMLSNQKPPLDFAISHGAIYISTPEGCIREAPQNRQEPAASITPSDGRTFKQESETSITTSDGQTFKEVKVLKTFGDKVLLIHSEGTTTVPLDALSDQTRKSLGLRTRAEQASFEAEQTQKGLVRSGNDWVTPEEKQTRDYFARLNTLCPDWKEINVNPQFAAWLDIPVPGQQTWRQVAEAGVKTLDAEDVAKVLNTWKADQKAALAAFVARLGNLVPDWRKVNLNPQFLACVRASNPGFPPDCWNRFMSFQQTQGQKGAEAVGRIMLAWKDKVSAEQRAKQDHDQAIQDILRGAEADRLAEQARQDEQDKADQRAEQIASAMQDQAQAIQNQAAAIQGLQNQINALQKVPSPDPATNPDADPFPGHY